MKTLGWASLGAVVLQGVLGGSARHPAEGPDRDLSCLPGPGVLRPARHHRPRHLADLAATRARRPTAPRPFAGALLAIVISGDHLRAARARRDHAPSASRSFDHGFSRSPTARSFPRTDPVDDRPDQSRARCASPSPTCPPVRSGCKWRTASARSSSGWRLLGFWLLVRRENGRFRSAPISRLSGSAS